MRQIVCMKWGTKFGAHDVNRLERMVRSHTTAPIRMVCLTDDPRGVSASIECVPLPAVPVVGARNDRGWKKLGLFSDALGRVVSGHVLYLDLDVAVIDSLDPFFEQPAPFLIIRDFKPFRYRHRFSGNSSVLWFEAGAHAALLDEVAARGEALRRDFRDEQEFVSDYMRRIGCLAYWPAGWCVSYKHDCVPTPPFGLFRAPRLPADTKIVVFHGRPKPDEAVIGVGAKWYRPTRPAPWLNRYLDAP